MGVHLGKRLLFAIGLLAIVVLSGVAYTYWTHRGSGTGGGTAATGTSVLTVVQTTVQTLMYPGDTAQPLSGNLNNPNSDPVHVTTASSTREQNAVTWATGQVGTTAYEWKCELFVENAFGTSGRYASAIADYNAMNSGGAIHAGDWNVPTGALAFFGATSLNGNSGHVMLSLGNGQFISSSVGGHVGYTTIPLFQASSGPYLGWSYADSAWAGR